MPCPPLLLFALRGSLQGTQTLGPEDLEGGPELSDGLGTRTVEALRPVTTLRDQARLFEDPEVLGDRRTRDVEAARDVADRELLARDETKDLAAARLTECGKRVDFASVSVSLPTVKALLRAPSPIHDSITTERDIHVACGPREPSPRRRTRR
jgi:hypothetical protein